MILCKFGGFQQLGGARSLPPPDLQGWAGNGRCPRQWRAALRMHEPRPGTGWVVLCSWTLGIFLEETTPTKNQGTFRVIMYMVAMVFGTCFFQRFSYEARLWKRWNCIENICETFLIFLEVGPDLFGTSSKFHQGGNGLLPRGNVLAKHSDQHARKDIVFI